MIHSLILFFIFFGTVSSQAANADSRRGVRPGSHRRFKPQHMYDSKEGNANERADLALEAVEKLMLWEEPVTVMDMDGPCQSCSFSGLVHLNRTGPATAIDLEDERKRIKLGLNFPSINASCNCSYWYILSGKVDIQIQDFIMYLDVIIDFDHEATEVRKVKIVDPGKVKAVFDGYGILGNVIDKFTWMFQGMMNRKVTSLIAIVVPKILQTEQRDRLFSLGMI